MVREEQQRDIAGERAALARSGRLHWVHWLVVGLSLVITFSAWYFTSQQVETKTRDRFDRAAQQVLELVTERMQKYEDGLWGGVAAIQAHGGDIGYQNWRTFAASLRIDLKYPGINGIGVIHHQTPAELAPYLAEQRRDRPDFKIYPEHANPDLFPITYIEPETGNAKAVGLDIAHETNRYTAALKARDSGDAQITGPIVLVQDAGQTPGFLFYAPFYRGGTYPTLEGRRTHFVGMVYAPFVFHKLMEGVLGKENRQVRIRVRDGADLLYDERSEADLDDDPTPLYSTEAAVELYGRTWAFDVWTTKSFRAASANSQPIMILIGGIFIDSLLLALFLLLSRANRRAVAFADRMAEDLQRNNAERLALAEENAEKERRLLKEQAEAGLLELSLEKEREKNTLQRQFVSMVSHEFRTPLAIIDGQAQFIRRRLDRITPDALERSQQKVQTAIERLIGLMERVLASARIEAGTVEFKPEPFDLQKMIGEICAQQAEISPDHEIVADLGALPPTVCGDQKLLRQLFANLLSNAVKYSPEGRRIEVGARVENSEIRLAVRDFGVGIPEEELPKLFSQFYRASTAKGIAGTGIGLNLARTFAEMHGGQVEVQSEVGVGSTFTLRLPDTAARAAA
jgi:signal transduction histidine kinase